VAVDLREYLDVMEGVKCMVYGRHRKNGIIPREKLGLYRTYA
jgi:hypothetical protein